MWIRRSVILSAQIFLLFSPALAQKSDPQEKLAMAYPGESWRLQIDAPGFEVKSKERKPDGREYLTAENSETKMFLSVMMERGKGPADEASCPDYLTDRLRSSPAGVYPTDVRSARIAGRAIIEYLVPEVQNVPVRQKNFVACLTHGNVYIDVHLSKVLFNPADEELFTGLLSKISIVDAEAFQGKTTASNSADPPTGSSKTSLDYMREGSAFYVANDFQKAIGPYQLALDLEKKDPKLDQTMWRVLVDNLGMAYGITGNLEQSEGTLNYGVSRDPKYPMFYYNLACVSAERGDMNKTMGFLREAFSHRADAIPGEGMPDPRHDDSFQKFMTDERFTRFVDSLNSPN